MVCDCGATWTDWATMATSAGTLVLAAFAWYQARQTKLQVNLGRDQLTAAQEAARAALDVHRESIRDRVDQFSPRVSVHYGTAGGPFYSPGALDLYERTDELDETKTSPASGMQFVLPRDGQSYIWFYGRAMIVNEGNVAARVRLPSAARFVSGRSAISGEVVGPPPFREIGIFDEALLGPGQHAQFQWSEGKTVSEWAEAAENPGKRLPSGSVWLWTVVFDSRDDGTIDTLMAHFKPDLLEAIPGTTGVWKVTDPTLWELISLPRRRRYRAEGAETEDVSQMHEYHDVDACGNGTTQERPDEG